MQEDKLQERLNSVWNGWVIDGVLGEGSYGKVYRIKREEFGHVYESALKVISVPQSKTEIRSAIAEGMDEESAKTYFYSVVKEIVEEFTFMSKLRGNTNIVSYEDHSVVSDKEEIGWDIYIRMELLTPLPEYFNNNPLSIRSIVKLGIDMCQALELCRRYNIIHRDVKPENIFVSDIGNYKLGDFGIARQLEKSSGNMSKKGTINYMAPEVYKGEKYDATVDIYSLGLVLYRFLNNNRMPFLPPYPQPLLYNDKEKANIMRMAGNEIAPPCNANGKLAAIILKACAFDAKDRYQNAEEMKRDLLSILNDDRTNDSVEEKQLKSEPIEKNGSLEKTDNPTEEVVSAPKNKGAIKVSNTQQGKSNSKKVFVIFLTIIVLALTGFFGVKMYKSSQECKVPKVIDMTVDEATYLLSTDKYKITVISSKEEYSDEIPKGHIISQSINDGETAKKGTQLSVVVSKGRLCKVPQLVGLERENAQKAVEGVGLQYKENEEAFSDTVPEGDVISQDYAEGAELEEGSIVTVTVSKGKEMAVVPNVEGLAAEEAEKKIKAAGLLVELSEEYSDTVEEGKIIRQDLEANSSVDLETVVKIVKSNGKQPVTNYNTTSKSSGNSSGKKKSGDIIWEEVD
ncbi:MAG: PASTA domain-containing protein [Lachnospiraceae bacterium]|nr:PASTA domain-containing protein [Lachnospiraceae bacterium]